MTGIEINERLSRATGRYEKLVETSLTTTHAHKRMDSGQKVRAVRGALRPSEIAILDMAVLKGRSLDALAEATKQPRANLERLLLQAAEKLADHFDGPAEVASGMAESGRNEASDDLGRSTLAPENEIVKETKGKPKKTQEKPNPVEKTGAITTSAPPQKPKK